MSSADGRRREDFRYRICSSSLEQKVHFISFDAPVANTTNGIFLNTTSSSGSYLLLPEVLVLVACRGL